MLNQRLQTCVKTLADTLHIDVIGFEKLDHAPIGMMIPDAIKQVWGILDENGRLSVIYMALKLHQLVR